MVDLDTATPEDRAHWLQLLVEQKAQEAKDAKAKAPK